MKNSQTMLRWALIGLSPLAIVAMGLTGGCKEGPPTGSSGPVDSDLAGLDKMQQFADQAEEAITTHLSSLPPAKDPTGPRRVIYLADFVNHTDTPSGDFELFMKRLRAKLASNPRVTHDFMILRDRAETQAMLNRNSAPGTSPEAVKTYAAENTYDLTGEFNDANRTEKRIFLINYQLVHASTGEIVVSSSYDLQQSH